MAFNPFEKIDEEYKQIQGIDPGTGEIQDNDYYYNPFTGKSDAVVSNNPKEEAKGAGFFGRFIDSLQAGASNVIAGQGDFINEFTGIGGDGANELNQIAKRNARLRNWSADQILADPFGYIKDPEGLTYDVGNMAGSGLALGGEAAAASVIGGETAAAARIGNLSTLSSTLANKAAAHGLGSLAKALNSKWGPLIVGNLVKTPFEAISEGGNEIQDMRKEGRSDSDIKKAALKDTGLNMLFLALSNSAESLGFGSALGKKISSRAGKAALGLAGLAGGAAHESYEEGVQRGISDWSKDENGDYSVLNPFNWSPGAKDEAMAAFGPGMVFGGTGAALSRIGNVGNNAGNQGADASDSAMNEGENASTSEGATAEGEEAAAAENAADENGGTSVDDVVDAMTQQESNGNPNAVNENTGAFGKMQIMPENWPKWSQEALGRVGDMTNQDDYDAVVSYKMNQYINEYGTEGAMVAWYAGPQNAQRWVDGMSTGIDADGNEYSFDAPLSNGPSVNEYVRQSMDNLEKKNGGGSAGPTFNPSAYADMEGTTWNRTEGVDVEDTQDVTRSGLADISKVYYDMFGIPLTVTSGNDSDVHQPGEHSHYAGVKLDVSGGVLDDAKKRHQFIAELEKRGITVLDEYENPSPNSTGGHLDLDFTDYKGAGNSRSGSSAQSNNSIPSLKEMLDYLKDNQMQFNDPDLNNAIDDALTGQDPQKVEDVFKTVKEQNEADAAASSALQDELNDKPQQQQEKFGGEPQGTTTRTQETRTAGPQQAQQQPKGKTGTQQAAPIKETNVYKNPSQIVSTVTQDNSNKKYSEALVNLAVKTMNGDKQAAETFSKIRPEDQKALLDIARQQQAQPSGNTANTAQPAQQAQTLNNKYSPVGNETTIQSDDSTKFGARYRLTDADDLITSHNLDNGMGVTVNPAYPSLLQPRDRANRPMWQQVVNIASNLDPSRLMDSQMINTGAPVINNKGYVLNGNGRMMAIKRAYDTNKGDVYKTALKQNAERLGLNPSDVDKFKKPVLVRQVDAPLGQYDKIISSKVGGADMNATEQAKMDAKKIRTSTLEKYVDNAAHTLDNQTNRTGFVSGILADITGGDVGKLNPLVNSNLEPSQEGVKRAENALFALAYGDDKLLDRAMLDSDDNTRNVTNAMKNAAPQFALLKKLAEDGLRYNVDVTAPMVEACNKLYALRKAGAKLDIYLKEQAMFKDVSPEAHTILEYINGNARSTKAMTEYYSCMASMIDALGNPQEDQTAMFQDVGTSPAQVTAKDIIEASYARMKGEMDNAIRKENQGIPQNDNAEQGNRNDNPEPGQAQPAAGENGVAPVEDRTGEGETADSGSKSNEVQTDNSRQTGEVVNGYPKGKPDFENTFVGGLSDYKQTARAYGDDVYITGKVRPADKALNRKSDLVERTMKFNLLDFDKHMPEKIRKIAMDANAGIFNLHPLNREPIGKYIFQTFKAAYQDTFPNRSNQTRKYLDSKDTDWGNFTHRAQGVADDLADAYHNSMMVLMQTYADWIKSRATTEASKGSENNTAQASETVKEPPKESSQQAPKEAPKESQATTLQEAKPAVDHNQQRYGNDHYFSDSVTDSNSGRTWARVGIQKGYNVLNGEFKRANKLAKEHKGHYSKFGGERGWVFNSDADRDAFLKDARHDAVDVPELKDKPEAQQTKAQNTETQQNDKTTETAGTTEAAGTIDDAIKQIRDKLLDDEDLAKFAKNNTENNFKLPLLDKAVDKALDLYNDYSEQGNEEVANGLAKLTDDKDAMAEALDPYIHEIYENLRGENAQQEETAAAEEPKEQGYSDKVRKVWFKLQKDFNSTKTGVNDNPAYVAMTNDHFNDLEYLIDTAKDISELPTERMLHEELSNYGRTAVVHDHNNVAQLEGRLNDLVRKLHEKEAELQGKASTAADNAEMQNKDNGKPDNGIIQTEETGMKGAENNAENGVSGMAPRTGERTSKNTVGESGVQGSGSGRRGGQNRKETGKGSQEQGTGNSGVSDSGSSSGGKTGNSTVQTEKSKDRRSGSSELPGSIADSYAGTPDDGGRRSDELVKSVKERPKHESPVAKAQAKENNPKLKAIRKALPMLAPEQANDVMLAENRLENANGMMFTNGTGTGKTYTGMGLVKRFYDAGKKNILVLAPSDDILKGWEEAARKSFGIKLTRLVDTNDSGKGPVTTTYANAGDNKEITKRDWDLIVCDESHKLMSGAQAKPTKALSAVRAMSSQADGFNRYFDDNHEKEAEELKKLNNEYKELHERLTFQTLKPGETIEQLRDRTKKAEDKYNKAYAQFTKLQKEEKANYKERPKAKVLFLSATPFQYVQDLDYANGYLFNYSDYGPMEEQGYNKANGKQQFFIENFGYRMRYNELNKPGADVDSTVMERAFNEKMSKSGALHGRMLASDYDYDRGFIRVDAGIGQKIDEGFSWLQDHKEKYDMLNDLFYYRFTGFPRFYLLEAIKADRAIPLIKAYVKKGKKVVVFHNFNKGGAENPFSLTQDDIDKIITSDENKDKLKRQYARFIKERPDLLRLNLSSLKSPIDTLSDAFGKNIAIYNGTLSKKERTAAIKAFNNDDSDTKIILVQSDAGQAGISLHDTTGKHQRVLINLGLPTKPSEAIQQEGRIYRFGNKSNALFRYLNTGTNFEQMAFAQKVAERAGTVENLAMGENARALKNAYVQAYEESQDGDEWKKYLPGSESEGTGGKANDYQQETMDDYERAKAFYFGKQKRDARSKSREGVDYYATPEPLGEKMVEWLHPQSGDSLLEPSAGDGAIARWMPSNTANTVIEPSIDLQARLMRNVNNVKAFNGTFENFDLHNKFNGIVMNPPFGSGGKTAIEHVAKAYRHLKDGGRLIAIIPDGPAANKRFDKWFNGDPEASRMEDRGISDGVLMATINLPEVTFQRAGTSVKTKIVVIDKYSSPKMREQAASLSDAPFELPGRTINEFFDNLENVSLPDRLNEDGKRYSVREKEDATTAPTENDYADSLHNNNESSDANVQRSLDSLKQEVQDAFPQAKISDIDASTMKVETPAGTITVDLQKKIVLGEQAEKKAKQEHGIAPNDDIVVEGYYKRPSLDRDAVIALSQESSEGSAYHEAFHAALDMALTDKEKAAMTQYYSKHANGKTVNEAMADGYKAWKRNRAQGKGSMFGKLFQKIKDFVAKVKTILTGVENVHNVMRKVAEGDVWNRSATINDASMKAAASRSASTAEQQERNAEPTAPNQIPAMFKTIPWKQGATNIDIGGGKHNATADYMKNEHDVANIVYDPYGRTREENLKAQEAVKGKGDTVTVANVLNVIKEPAWRKNVILQAAKALKPDGTAYFQIYEGNESGVANASQKQESFQNNMKTADYVPEIQRYFADVEQRGKLIIAKDPVFDPDEKAAWSVDDLATDDLAFSVRNANDNLKDSFGMKLKKTKDGVKVRMKFNDKEREFTITQSLFRSPSYIAEHVPVFKLFFKMADRAMSEQEHLRNSFNKKLNRIHKLYLHSKDDIKQWSDILWQGDAEGKEYSKEELKAMGLSDNVISAYRATRIAIAKAYDLLNEARLHVQTYQKNVTKEGYQELANNKFVDIQKVEQRGDNHYIVTFKKPKTWKSSNVVTKKVFDEMKRNENVRIISSKKIGSNAYDVAYEERMGDIHKRGGYIPHFFHNFFVMDTDADGNNVVVGSGRTVKEALKVCDEYAKTHKDAQLTIAPKTFNFADDSAVRAAEISDGQYFAMVSKIEDQLQMTPAQAREFLSDKVKMAGRHRFFGNFLERKGALGFEQNMNWVLAHYFNSVSRYVALEGFKPNAISLFERYFGDFNKDHKNNALAEYVKKYIQDINGNPNSIELKINDWLNHQKWWRDFVASKYGDRAALQLTQNITSVIGIAKLGFGNVSSALLNLGQIVNAVGITGDMKATARAMKDALRSDYKVAKILHDCGVVDDIRVDAGSSGYTAFRPRNLLGKTMFMFSTMDMYSRKVAALSGFYHAMKEGKNYKEAIEFGRTVNRKANFDYSPADAPAIFRSVSGSVVGDVALQFQKYKVKEMELMYDIAKHGDFGKNVKFWGMYFMLAGLLQFPAVDWFNDLFKQLLGVDYKLKLKGAVMDAAGNSEVGRSLAKIAMYGLLSAKPINIDISQRFGMGDFVVPPQKTIVDILGGPTLSTATQMYLGIHNNNPLQVIKGFSPALGNYAQVLMERTVDKRGRTMRELESPYDKLVKAIGFRLADESINSDISQIKSQRMQEAKEERQNFVRELLDKEESGEQRSPEDIKKMKELGITNKKLKAYRNDRNRSYKDRINGTSSKNFKKDNEGLLNFNN